MFCANCGQSVEDGEKFCFHCGKAVVKRDVVVPDVNNSKAIVESVLPASKPQANISTNAHSIQPKQIQTNSGQPPMFWFILFLMAASGFTIFLPWLKVSSNVNSSMGNANATMSASPGLVYAWVLILSIGAAFWIFFKKQTFTIFGLFASSINLITGIGFVNFWKDDYLKASAEYGESFAKLETSVETGEGVALLILFSAIYLFLALVNLLPNKKNTTNKPVHSYTADNDLGLITCNSYSPSIKLVVPDKSLHPTSGEELYLAGKMHLKSQHDEEAIRCFLGASDLNHGAAQFSLASMFLSGVCVEKNIPKSIEFFTKAAENGNVDAQYHLGKICIEGKLVSANTEVGLEWLKKAAEAGHQYAKDDLENLKKS